MSRTKIKGNSYNFRVNGGKGKKRGRAIADLKSQGDYDRVNRGPARVKCSTCGTEVVHPYTDIDGVTRCALCAVKAISARRAQAQ